MGAFGTGVRFEWCFFVFLWLVCAEVCAAAECPANTTAGKHAHESPRDTAIGSHFVEVFMLNEPRRAECYSSPRDIVNYLRV